MRIRSYTEADLGAVRRMHAPFADFYNLPDFGNPLFIENLVVTNGNHRTVMSAHARLTSEVYVLVDHEDGTPNQRWERLKMLHEVMRQQLVKSGIEDVHCWIPPDIPEGFFRRLQRLGWTEEKFRCMWRKTEAPGN
jgi:hypothetical protein